MSSRSKLTIFALNFLQYFIKKNNKIKSENIIWNVYKL